MLLDYTFGCLSITSPEEICICIFPTSVKTFSDIKNVVDCREISSDGNFHLAAF